MASHSLRLLLIVRRYALPEARIIFTISLETDPTVAKLLEQVNDVVPLESSDWGLEDYVVEVKSAASGYAFDCLHFQPVSSVLKDGEEVM